MPFAECTLGPLISSNNAHGFVWMATTVDDLSYTPNEQERSRDAAQIVATGRKSWKTMKGRGEAVWPPLLEAALIEALRAYKPGDNAKVNGRFPNRNRFISDYILKHTKKRRTAKQVGSRIQQIRDTCKDVEILELILRKRPSLSPIRSSRSPPLVSTYSPSVSSPSASLSDSDSDFSHSEASVSPPPEYVCPVWTKPLFVDILLQKTLWAATTPIIDLSQGDAVNQQSIQLAPCLFMAGRGLRQHHHSSILPFLSSRVEIYFPYPLVLHSSFKVYSADSADAVHAERVPMSDLPSSTNQSAFRYSMELIPAFWGKLCSTKDVTRYSIVQILTPAVHATSQSPPQSVSIVYRFVNTPTNAIECLSSSPVLESSPSNESVSTLPSPVHSDVVDHQWTPSRKDSPEFVYSPDQEQDYHVEHSYRIISSGNPHLLSTNSFNSPPQRCTDFLNSTMNQLTPRYQHGQVASQAYPGSYCSMNADYIPYVNAQQQQNYQSHTFYPAGY